MRTIVKHDGARYIRAASASGRTMRKSSVSVEAWYVYVARISADGKQSREIVGFGLSRRAAVSMFMREVSRRDEQDSVFVYFDREKY